jgi:drug/metabolite transporter (DMT)-like permease
MISDYQLGVIQAGSVALCWTVSSVSFSLAGKRVGALRVNIVRLLAAVLLLTLVNAVWLGAPIPTHATSYQVLWLALSGFIGFFIGDLTLFRAFVLIGPRASSVVMSLAPAFAAAVGYLWLGESMSLMQVLGVVLTLAGVLWVVAERQASTAPPEDAVTSLASGATSIHATPPAMSDPATPASPGSGVISIDDTRSDVNAARSFVEPSSHRIDAGVHRSMSTMTQRVWMVGVLLALIGAACQGVGAVMTRHAFANGPLDPVASTQIRALAAMPCFLLLMVILRRSRSTFASLADGRAQSLIWLGAVFGPVLGVSLLNASLARIHSGIASTLAGLVPVIMLPVAYFLLREKLGFRAILGALMAVSGVALLALGDEPQVDATEPITESRR